MSKHYSKENYNMPDAVNTRWSNIVLSPKTVQERNRIKARIDDFASFTWRGIDAFKVFGAFIINNKNSLKFYNGPAFSNEYTKPQFETAAGQLTGVTFQVQKIDFMIGVYWISEEDYRKLIYWLHPYEINTLTFGFEPNYYYQVKLSSIDNGTRYIVGQENNQYMYYTEMKLTFEIQGAAVAYGNTYFDNEITLSENSETNTGVSADRQKVECFSIFTDERNSDLETPLIIESIINLGNIKRNIQVAEQEYHLLFSAYVLYEESNEEQKLFEVEFKNLAFGPFLDNTDNKLHITYNSDSALLFLEKGDSRQEILTRLTTLTSGDRMVDHMSIEQFRIPGNFNDWDFQLQNMKIKYNLELVTITNAVTSEHAWSFNSESQEEKVEDYLDVQVLSRPRTNLI